MSAFAIYQVNGEYLAASDFGEGLGERRVCGVASYESGQEIARWWNEDATESARIRKARLMDEPLVKGHGRPMHDAETAADPTPTDPLRLTLVSMEGK